MTRKAEVTVKRATGETLPAGTKVNLLVNGQPLEGTVNAAGKIDITRTIKSNASETLRIALAESPEATKSTTLFGANPRIGQVELIQAAREIDQSVEVAVKNYDGSVSKNTTHTVTVNGKAQRITTNGQGVATIPVKVTEGEPTTFAVALQDRPAEPQSAVVEAKQGAAPAKVTLTLAATEVTMPVRVTVNGEDGKPAANTKVELLIDGTPLTATTNPSGVATFEHKLNERERKNATIRVAGGTPKNVILVGKRDAQPIAVAVTAPKVTTAAPTTTMTPAPSDDTTTVPAPTTDSADTTTTEPAPEPAPNEKSSVDSPGMKLVWIILGTLLGGLGLGALGGWAVQTYNIRLPF